MGLKDWIVPQNTTFFDRFEQLSDIVLTASTELVALVENYENVEIKAQSIKKLENQGDEITHEIFELLNKAFVTPLEPEEISRLTIALDNVLDYINGCARNMYYFGVEKSDPFMVDLARLIHLSVIEISAAVRQIRKIRDPHLVENHCIEVNRLENLADEILQEALMAIFTKSDAVHILKMKNIYNYMETVTDKCEDAANVLSDIAIRHS